MSSLLSDQVKALDENGLTHKCSVVTLKIFLCIFDNFDSNVDTKDALTNVCRRVARNVIINILLQNLNYAFA